MLYSLVVSIALLAASLVSVTALQCYSCEGRESEMCGRNPTAARIVTCATNEMCNVLRTERTESFGGRTVTISRGCRQSAFAGAVAGPGIATTSQSCSTDLCNTGNGLGPSFGNHQNDGINFPGFPSFPQFPQFPQFPAAGNNVDNSHGDFNQQSQSNNQFRPGNSATVPLLGSLLWVPLIFSLSSILYLSL